MSDPSSTVIFHRAGRSVPRREVKQLAVRIRVSVASGREFSCLLTDDRELRRLNRQFLGRDYATDVLSFPMEGPEGISPLGEIAISTQRAAEQAREQGHSLEQEIGILMLHGVLHLLGFDHETDRGRMARAEAHWRKELGLPAGLIERVRS